MGGWLPAFDGDGLVDKWASPWFHIELDSVGAPWAFAKGLAYRYNSALELLATTVGVILLRLFEEDGGQ